MSDEENPQVEIEDEDDDEGGEQSEGDNEGDEEDEDDDDDEEEDGADEKQEIELGSEDTGDEEDDMSNDDGDDNEDDDDDENDEDDDEDDGEVEDEEGESVLARFFSQPFDWLQFFSLLFSPFFIMQKLTPQQGKKTTMVTKKMRMMMVTGMWTKRMTKTLRKMTRMKILVLLHCWDQKSTTRRMQRKISNQMRMVRTMILVKKMMRKETMKKTGNQ